VARPRDHERGPRAQDLDRLAEDHLHLPWIAVGARELDGARRRLDRVQPDDAAFRLRDRLLGDDDDVSGRKAARADTGVREEPPQVVALLDLGEALEADHADLGGHLSGGR